MAYSFFCRFCLCSFVCLPLPTSKSFSALFNSRWNHPNRSVVWHFALLICSNRFSAAFQFALSENYFASQSIQELGKLVHEYLKLSSDFLNKMHCKIFMKILTLPFTQFPGNIRDDHGKFWFTGNSNFTLTSTFAVVWVSVSDFVVYGKYCTLTLTFAVSWHVCKFYGIFAKNYFFVDGTIILNSR